MNDKDAYTQGIKQYFESDGVYTNPFPIGTPEYNEFERGWMQSLKRDGAGKAEYVRPRHVGPNNSVTPTYRSSPHSPDVEHIDTDAISIGASPFQPSATSTSNIPRRATASAFANWVYERTVRGRPMSAEYLEGATRQHRLTLGAITHLDIEKLLRLSWMRDFLGSRADHKWRLFFADTKERPDRIFKASRLDFEGQALRCIPDVVLECLSDPIILIIERKTTRVPENRIPPLGWPNVEAQLWCYSWIDDFRGASEILLVGQLWYRDRGGLTLCHKHPAWQRSDSQHEHRCGEWFREYGGLIRENL